MTFDGSFFSTVSFENKVKFWTFFILNSVLHLVCQLLRGRLNNYGYKGRGTVIDNQELRAIVQSKIFGPGPLRAIGKAIWYVL